MEQTEGRLQQTIFTRHWNQHPKERRMLFAINNNSVNRIKGAQMKSIGVVSGVSDMIYLNPRTGQPQFLELKLPHGRQSPNQIEFQSIVESMGFEYHIIKTIEDFNKATGLTLK